MLINTYVDDVLIKVMKRLGLEIPEYSNDIDPTKRAEDVVLDWTIRKEDISEVKQLYNMYCKKHRKRKSVDKKDGHLKKLAQEKPDAFIKTDCESNSSVLKQEVL